MPNTRSISKIVLALILVASVANAGSVIKIESGGGGGGGGAFTFIASANGADDTNDVDISTSTTLNVQAGDLLIGAVQWEDTDTTVSSFTDGGSTPNTLSFTTGDDVHSAGNEINLYPLVRTSAVTNSAATFTVTLGSARQFKKMVVLQFRPAGCPGACETVTRDVSGTREANGNSASILSGSFSTTGTDNVVCGIAGIYTGGVWSAQTLAGSASTDNASPSGITGWCRRVSSALSTQTASSTYSQTRFWAATVLSYKSE